MTGVQTCALPIFVTYFVQGQGPVALCTIASVAIGHFFVQRWFDKKEGALANKEDTKESALDVDKALEGAGPAYYAILPMLPLGLLIGFSPLVYKAIKLNLVTAIIVEIPPILFKPRANISAQTIKLTVEVKTLPIPSKIA